MTNATSGGDATCEHCGSPMHEATIALKEIDYEPKKGMQRPEVKFSKTLRDTKCTNPDCPGEKPAGEAEEPAED